MNYKCSRWFDWFSGGLHFHNEHHTMPCMPRQNLRFISYDIKALMKKHEVAYEYDWLPKVLKQTVFHFGELAVTYRKDQEKRREKAK